ncbi:SWIM zinc finger [Chitinophaga sp. CF118]|uniref:SWIM zinc finger family protein n=1 Tax=Chitinophaga sp. CF118 TaxID=1884367 RepID=UPI0008E39042|nr:SWIM zinc finger family protein [Chitinophaga sp. CF118]SFD01933.1 SWIM zinc finger [Chitinophaga sp. CF118]
MQLTEEQVLALAPDDSSRKAGRELSGPSKWVTKGANEQALWGECQGSGSKPYQTQVDLNGMAFKCSCPSRKFPCKHGIGLLILYARQPADFTTTEPPAWVSEWLGKREEKDTKKKEKPTNEAAQVKRQQAREQSVEDGLAELLLWIKDIVRNGLIGIPEKDPSFFINMTRRMVDAKAPGLAGLVKTASNLNFYREGWQTEFTDLLVRMYLLIAGYTNKQSPALLEDLRSGIGFTQSQDELREQKGITDIWLVLGKQTEEEDSLTVERNWLYGINSKKYALVLQFSAMSQAMPLNLIPGFFLQAELVYYPSAQPLRALIKSQVVAATIPPVSGISSWQEVAELETAYNSVLPFNTARPFLMQQVRPVQYEGSWWLADSSNRLVKVKESFTGIYRLMAISGGKPLDLAVLGSENNYEPLGILWGNQYIFLSN